MWLPIIYFYVRLQVFPAVKKETQRVSAANISFSRAVKFNFILITKYGYKL